MNGIQINNLYLGIFVASLLFYFIIHPIINYWNWISWWNSKKYIGNPNGYDCVDMFSLAFANQNYITYYIYNLLGPALGNTYSRFTNDGQLIFVQAMMMSLSTEVGGFLVPRDLCGSIVPGQESRNGPWPTDEAGWRTWLMGWAKIPSNTVFNTLKDYHPDTTAWAAEPDNFLFNVWGIGADSPLVASFITKLNEDLGGGLLYYTSMNQLLGVGIPGIPGGWFGMLVTNEKSLQDIASIYNFIWTKEAIPEYIKKGEQKAQASKCNASLAGPIGSGVVSGVMLGAMLTELGPLGWIIGFAVGSAMIAAAVIPACA